MNKKLQTLLILSAYIAITVGTYYIVMRCMHREFTELHLLYAILIGCLAYMPRFLMIRKRNNR